MSNEANRQHGTDPRPGGKRIIQPLIPIPVDPMERIRELEALLVDPKTNQKQLKNIQAALDDRRKGTCHWGYQGGKPIDGPREYDRSSEEALWLEVLPYI
ncbi:hypothetical protein ABW21_db0200469 [Orbilia brochopaga]|nr:hypothetical protein ABW21_db0200469 [Drechslerella brochopaga]